MFAGCSQFNQSLNSWHIRQDADTSDMFAMAWKFNPLRNINEWSRLNPHVNYHELSIPYIWQISTMWDTICSYVCSMEMVWTVLALVCLYYGIVIESDD